MDFKRTENRYYAQKVRYEQALKAWNDCTVQAPFAGIVAEKDNRITKGSYIVPGIPIARIVDSSLYTVSISLGERQIGFLKKGQKVSITIPAASDEKVEGEVTAVAGGSNQQTGSYTAIVTWKNESGGKVKSGMSANVMILINSEEKQIIIPRFALIKKTDGDYVFTAAGNAARLSKVRSGNTFGERIEIIEGISPGDLIIITRISTLVSGERISIRNVGKSGEWQ